MKLRSTTSCARAGSMRKKCAKDLLTATRMPSMPLFLRSISTRFGPMVATPGDPRNGIPIDELADEVRIDAAYGGSCTGGKMADMDMYAEVLENALAQWQASG